MEDHQLKPAYFEMMPGPGQRSDHFLMQLELPGTYFRARVDFHFFAMVTFWRRVRRFTAYSRREAADLFFVSVKASSLADRRARRWAG